MTATARAAVPLALAVYVLACEGKRPASDAVAAAEHVQISRSTHTLAPRPYDAAATPAGAESKRIERRCRGSGRRRRRRRIVGR